MRISKSIQILQKSIEAANAAIELYNKPIFSYRDECFSILMINAWELLLKAKKVKENGNNIKVLYVKEKFKNKKGNSTKREIYKRNRTNNYLTQSINELIASEIDDENLKSNLTLLIEIRDNAIHCINKSNLLGMHYLEIITATLSSYQTALKEWFSRFVVDDRMFIIPVGFNLPKEFKLTKGVSKEEKNILKFISEQRNNTSNTSDFDIALNIEVKFLKSNDENAQKIVYSENGIPISINAEDDFTRKYPLSYDELISKLKKRYKNFKQDKAFYVLKKTLEKKWQICKSKISRFSKTKRNKKNIL